VPRPPGAARLRWVFGTNGHRLTDDGLAGDVDISSTKSPRWRNGRCAPPAALDRRQAGQQRARTPVLRQKHGLTFEAWSPPTRRRKRSMAGDSMPSSRCRSILVPRPFPDRRGGVPRGSGVAALRSFSTRRKTSRGGRTGAPRGRRVRRHRPTRRTRTPRSRSPGRSSLVPPERP
jgi:hypothetical protein